MQHSAQLRIDDATRVRDDIDSGTGPGHLKIKQGATVLADIVLGDPCGTVSGPTLTFSGFPRSDTAADASGTADTAVVEDSDAGTSLTLTVGVTGADLNLVTLSIVAGQPVQITSASYTAAV